VAVFLKTNECEEAVFALEVVAEWLERAERDIGYWKWVILALHNAVQGFMVLALRGSNGLCPLKDDIAKKWLSAYESGKPYPTEKIDTFLNLYKKVKSKEMMCFYIYSKEVIPSSTLDHNIKKLNSLRNKFVHFVPIFWELEVSDLPEISLDCLILVEFLALECGNIVFYKEEYIELCKKAIATIKIILTRAIEASRPA
jgi:hypothetical protein